MIDEVNLPVKDSDLKKDVEPDNFDIFLSNHSVQILRHLTNFLCIFISVISPIKHEE